MRSYYVDYLRGLSILLVLGVHFAILPLDFPGVRELTYLTRNGYYGVSIFFVISGYLITSRIIARFGCLGRVSFRAFYALRVGRIVPCLVVSITVLLVLGSIGPREFNARGDVLWRMAWYAVTFRFNHYRLLYGTPILAWAVLWSLSIEEVFYIVFPLICRIYSKAHYIFLLLLVIVAFGPYYRFHYRGSSPTDCLYTYFGCFDLIALGCAAAIAANAYPIRTNRIASFAGILGLILTLGGVIAFPIDQRMAVGPSVIGAGAAGYLYAFHGRTGAGRIHLILRFAPRALAACGRLSYEIYLFHGFLIILVLKLYASLTPAEKLSPMLSLGFAGLFAGSTLLVSFLVARYYSEPVGKFLRFSLTKELPNRFKSEFTSS